ncbi:MAG: helix-turn-helix domain-containing protein, partial [Luteimonas sp.]|nr:helix-turn-helix domain-containing protein [Luteimonas sp.]
RAAAEGGDALNDSTITRNAEHDIHMTEAHEALGVIETRSLYDPIPPTALAAVSKHDQNRLVSTIGQRMRSARELCNLSQSEAARRFGYSNPSKLSKVEAAADTNSVPLWLIRKAAEVYEVPTDFLFGITDDFETGVPRGTQAWLIDAWDRMRQRDLLALDRLHREVVAVAGGSGAVLGAVRELSMAVSRYVESNRDDFENARGGATVLHKLGQLEAAATTFEVGLRKLQIDTRGA